MLHIGRARHPGPGVSGDLVDHLSRLSLSTLVVDLLMVIPMLSSWLWLSTGKSCQGKVYLRKAGCQSVWAPACQNQISDGRAGVGVIRLRGALLSAPWEWP